MPEERAAGSAEPHREPHAPDAAPEGAGGAPTGEAPAGPTAPHDAEAAGRPPWKRPWVLVAAAAAVVAAVVLAVVLSGGSPVGPPPPPPPPAIADAVPFDGRSPREPSAEGTRVLVALPRPSLGRAGITAPAAQRRYVASLRDESRALRSALAARGVRLSDVVAFERVFNGFAATVRTRDLADLDSLGVRVRPVRRFYPATAEPVPVDGVGPPPVPATPPIGLPVAVLASGVDATQPLFADRLDEGRDVVERDDDTKPGEDPRGGRRETSGTVLAGILAAAGERVLPIRIAALQPAAQGTGLEEVALSDQLLAGLERAVDPDGDGATDDHVGVALVGVNAPYAGFADSSEARAARAAAALGTLVVAPAGQEGAGAGSVGTVGSPGAAPTALSVAALAAPAAVSRVRLDLGDAELPGAALLGGPPPPRGLRTGAPLRNADTAPDAGALRGRLAIVEAGNAPTARAAAAVGAGARAVLLAEPRPGRPLPAMPAGRFGVPVLGVTGAGARDALDADDGTAVELGAPEPGRATAAPAGDAPAALSPFSSRGPSAAGAVKPDLAAAGAVLTVVPGGGGAVVGGTAVAAAEVAVEAARLARTRPDATPAQLRAALTAAAQAAAAPPVTGAGAGVLQTPPASAVLTAATRPRRREDPCPGDVPCVRVLLANRSVTNLDVDLSVIGDPGSLVDVAPARLTVPAGGRREAEITLFAGGDRLASGRLVASSAGQQALVHPFAVRLGKPPALPIGPMTLQRRGRGVTGVRFPLGAFELGDPIGAGTTVRLASRLDLSLVESGSNQTIERLTPFAGARELLPAEYAYTLPASVLSGLASGRYAFRAVARSPAGGAPAVARSRRFRR